MQADCPLNVDSAQEDGIKGTPLVTQDKGQV